MRNIFTKAGILIGVALMACTSSYAQASGIYRADIPFDFTVKNESYSAGDYSIRPLNGINSALTLVNRKTGITRVIGLSHAGSEMQGSDGKLMFEKVNGVFALVRVATPSYELRMKAPQGDERLASNISKKKETATVRLGH